MSSLPPLNWLIIRSSDCADALSSFYISFSRPIRILTGSVLVSEHSDSFCCCPLSLLALLLLLLPPALSVQLLEFAQALLERSSNTFRSVRPASQLPQQLLEVVPGSLEAALVLVPELYEAAFESSHSQYFSNSSFSSLAAIDRSGELCALTLPPLLLLAPGCPQQALNLLGKRSLLLVCSYCCTACFLKAVSAVGCLARGHLRPQVVEGERWDLGVGGHLGRCLCGEAVRSCALSRTAGRCMIISISGSPAY